MVLAGFIVLQQEKFPNEACLKELRKKSELFKRASFALYSDFLISKEDLNS